MRKMRQSWRVRHLRAHSALFAAREFLKKVKKKEKEKERERKKEHRHTHTESQKNLNIHLSSVIFFQEKRKNSHPDRSATRV